MNNIISKISCLRFIFVEFPERTLRLIAHFSYVIPFIKYRLPSKPKNITIWAMDLLFFINDLIGITDLIHTIHLISKNSFRRMSKNEIIAVQNIFQNTIDYNSIWIDDQSKIGMHSLARAYVLFNTINYRYKIDIPTLVHEMVHIWQYQNLGSIYLGRSLLAQTLGNPYDFGGTEKLYDDMIKGKSLLNYNFEQQGSIIEYLTAINMHQSGHPLLNSITRYFYDQILKINHK